MDITIKKIKAAKGKLVFEYDKKEEGNTPISTHKSTFEEEPEPSFWSAFGYLRADVCRILEVDPGQHARRIVPTGVSYSTDTNGYEGAIITCEYHMPKSGTMTTINTPLLRFPQTDEQVGLPSHFSEETEEHLRNLIHEAVRYLEGHRGQGGLFDDDGQDPRNVTPEDSPVRLAAVGQSGTDIRQIAG